VSTPPTRKTFFAKLIGLMAVSVGGSRLAARQFSATATAPADKSALTVRPEQRAVSRQTGQA
jgi:hypothetical protein